ncbi:response regulator transcription factor [Conexibacter stalactiti]|uniref:Response regulator transcription factor n=1 Tax=Conexibacter stalactiti TaxID=1940611 RepID=A0ABU4HU21_9ACTN|nr:response regulator transcription factor [Conexibacter stalactiti]MDW5596745.1 response regulator transcription factor [Conexibacter stalactiti]MEC5037387.1 response regulator transcription factor [Conexibacter stalactiti]
MPTTIAICDDHALVRGGLKMMLEREPDLEVVGEAGDGAEAVELVLRLHPDVVLMDVELPGIDGIEAIRRLRAAGSRAQALVVTTFDDDEYLVRALRAGAAGFVLKAIAPERLTEAVRTVARGDALLDPAVTRRLVERFLGHPALGDEMRERLAELTERERDVLRELARGGSNAAIGSALHLSEPTVKAHVTQVLSKLGVGSRVQAVVFAYESGFVRPGEG